MKRQITSSFLLLISFCFVFIGCSKNDSYKNSIPQNAQIVLSVNLKSLFDKAGLKEFQETNFYQELINSLPPDFENKDFFEKIMKDPEISGIDFEKDAFLFRIDDKDITCFLLKLKSYSKFQDFFKEISKDKKVTIEETDDYYYFQASKENILAWDNEKLIFINTDKRKYRDSLQIYLSKYMKSDQNNSIFSDNDFSEFYKNKKDINLWISLDFNQTKDNYDQSKFDSLLSSDIMKGSKFYLNLEFTNSEIIVTGKTVVSENLSKKFDFSSAMKDGLSDNIMKTAPLKSLGIISFAVNLSKYIEIIGQLIGTNILDSPLNETMKVSNLTDLFSGEFVLCLNDFSKKITSVNYTFFNDFGTENFYDTSYVPVFSLFALMKDTTQLSKIISSLKIPFEYKDNYYILNIDENDRVYFGFKNNVMVLTFNKEYLDKLLLAQTESDALINHKFSKSFKNNPTAIFIDINYKNFSEGTNGFLSKIFGNYNAVKAFMEPYDSFIYEARNDNTFLASIKMRDSTKNSLYNILHNLDKNIPRNNFSN